MRIISRKLLVVIAISVFANTSCESSLSLQVSEQDRWESINQTGAYLGFSEALPSVIELRENYTINAFLSLTKDVEHLLRANITINENQLDAYNAEHQTSFPILPKESVSIENEGNIILPPSRKKSDFVEIRLNASEGLVKGQIYALPIRIDSEDSGFKFLPDRQSKTLLVRYSGDIPSTDKGTGIITIAYVECNSNNPLNAGEWTLKTKKTPIYDIVNLFAANINYNKEQGRIWLNVNSNLMHILNNRDKYIKPLQDKGIKVCLSILGNHDGTGVANLSEASAKDFARQLKAIVDAYGLDGVDFDDEWSDYDKHETPPGCVKRSPEAYARLCYETKQIMPDKLCMVYFVGACVPWPEQGFSGFNKAINGVFPGDFIDYSYYAQYGAISTGYNTIIGMRKSQWGPTSLDMQDWVNSPNIKYCRDNGFGVQVTYDLRAAEGAYENMYQTTLNEIAKILYNDSGATYSGKAHKVDW